MVQNSVPKTICLLCDQAFWRTSGASAFWDLVVEEAHRRAAKQQARLEFHFVQPTTSDAPPLSQSLLSAINSGTVQGILAVSAHPSAVWWMRRELKVPVVTFAGPGAWRVALDTETSMRLAVGELALRGCRHIGLWTAVPPLVRLTSLRHEAKRARGMRHMFRQALEIQQAEYFSGLVRVNWGLVRRAEDRVVTLSFHEQGYRLAHEVFGGQQERRASVRERGKVVRPDGIFIFNDLVTRGALVALHELGLRPGIDVHIATTANVGSPVLMGQEQGLILVENDPRQIVLTMFSMLETLMQGGTPPQDFVRIEPTLRVP